MRFEYTREVNLLTLWLVRGDGRREVQWRGSEVMIAFDRDPLVLMKHGEPARVQAWVEKTKALLRPEIAKDLLSVTIPAVPMGTQTKVADIDVELTKLVNISGYLKTFLARCSIDLSTLS